MFIYKGLFNEQSKEGAIASTPFFSSIFMPFVEADQMNIKNLAMNHMVIQRNDNSVYNKDGERDEKEKYPIYVNPNNINNRTYAFWNKDTEFNGAFDGDAEGGNIKFEGETIEAVIVRRSTARTKHKLWEDIAVIPIDEKTIYTLNKTIYDPFIEHGLTYQYAIQPVSRTGIRGMQLATSKRYAFYEDCWILGADNRQLMVGYNPEVSSVKTVVKDSLIETIGGKYPYVIRNSDVGYKQFSFGCTITYHMNIGQSFTENANMWVDDEYKKDVDDSTGGDQGQPDGDNQEDIIRLYEAIVIDKNISMRVSPVDGSPIINKPNFNYLHRRYEVADKVANLPTDEAGYELFDGKRLRPGRWMETFDGKWIGIKLPLDQAKEPRPDEDIPATGYYIAWVKPSDETGIREVEPIQSLSLFRKEGSPSVNNNLPAAFFSVGGNTELVAPVSSFSIEDKAITDGGVDTDKDLGFESESDLDNKMENYEVFDERMDISDKVFMQEREFRNRVMNFLYDGQPKIFKSPTEGLVLVRLTDISFTPKNELGRKIYDFSCTMTEIGKIDTESLAKYNFREAIGDTPIVTPDEATSPMEVKEAQQLYELFGTI